MRTILIADDHVLMREALMHLIASAFESVAFECVSGFHETEHRLRAISNADHPDGYRSDFGFAYAWDEWFGVGSVSIGCGEELPDCGVF